MMRKLIAPGAAGLIPARRAADANANPVLNRDATPRPR